MQQGVQQDIQKHPVEAAYQAAAVVVGQLEELEGCTTGAWLVHCCKEGLLVVAAAAVEADSQFGVLERSPVVVAVVVVAAVVIVEEAEGWKHMHRHMENFAAEVVHCILVH